ncbi:hypothetical protein BDV25DRAFT_143571 [Aspergillus avenaceus]|uniref:Amine oxidase, flavin-containing superfamily n=1 Tax=Aspergillus avenaceus TaxID=36643 RepID=A0A5N6TJQ7_ASPAV|nr:hypothetical protein BDV25DRAFT_143571 [Aspergillus avenaceus]
MFTLVCLAAFAGLVSLSLAESTNNSFECKNSTSRDVDVAVIGGGASGTYAAVRLHSQDQKVVLIETKNRLGGQVNTYVDPETKQTVDYGVNQYTNLTEAREFLDYLQVPYLPYESEGVSLTSIDFATARVLPAPDQNATFAQMSRYMRQVRQYPYLELGFDLPDPVPEDLALPFVEFARKYGVTSFTQTISPAMGDVLHFPAIYVLKHWGAHMFGADFLTPANTGNQGIYDRALEVLGSSVLLSSRTRAIQRASDNQGGVQLCVDSGEGTQHIRAKRLVIAIPSPDTILYQIGLDVTDQERSLLSQFRPIGFYTSLVRISGIPPHRGFQNVDANEPVYRVPKLPGIYRIIPKEIPGTYLIEYGAETVIPDDEVRQNIIADVRRLQDSGAVAGGEDPEIIEFDNHSPFYPYVSGEAIRDGFYRQLNSLQGQQNTFWTGSAFHIPDSAKLWRFTKGVMQNLTEGL